MVAMAPPHRGYAKDLLEAQHHPNRTNGAGGPPKRSYDMAGWTLPYQMGVRADMIKETFNADLEEGRPAAFAEASAPKKPDTTYQPTAETDPPTKPSMKTAMDAL